MKGCAKGDFDAPKLCATCDFCEDSSMCREKMERDHRRKFEVVKYRWRK